MGPVEAGKSTLLNIFGTTGEEYEATSILLEIEASMSMHKEHERYAVAHKLSSVNKKFFQSYHLIV